MKNSQKNYDDIAMELVEEVGDKCFVDDEVYIENCTNEGKYKIVKINRATSMVTISNGSVEKEIDACNIYRCVPICIADIYLFLSYIVKPGPIQNILVDNLLKKIKEKDFFRTNKPCFQAQQRQFGFNETKAIQGYYASETGLRELTVKRPGPQQMQQPISASRPMAQPPRKLPNSPKTLHNYYNMPSLKPPVLPSEPVKKLQITKKVEPFIIEKELSLLKLNVNPKLKDCLYEVVKIYNFFKTHEHLFDFENFNFTTFSEDLVDVGRENAFFDLFKKLFAFAADEFLDSESKILDSIRGYVDYTMKENDISVINKKFNTMELNTYKNEYKYFISEMCVFLGDNKLMNLSTFFSVGKSIKTRLEILKIWMDFMFLTEKLNIYTCAIISTKKQAGSRKGGNKRRRFDDLKRNTYAQKVTSLLVESKIKQEFIHKNSIYTVFLWNKENIAVFKNENRNILYEISSFKDAERFNSFLNKSKNGLAAAVKIKSIITSKTN